MGNNNYDQFEKERGVTEPIQGQKSISNYELEHTDGTKKRTGVQANDFFASEMETNYMLRPPAGITEVESKTEGPFGTIRRTTVNFVVHNFDDYQNIYNRYFLKPGAQVVVDWGWDSVNSSLYDPRKLIEDGTNIRDFIYGKEGEQGRGK